MLNYFPWQKSQWDKLQTAIKQDRIPHALLLVGGQGTGIPQFTEALSAGMLCKQAVDGEACGECQSCILFQAGNHPDLHRVEPEEAGKQIKVDAVRELINSIQLSSQYGRYKIAVINPADAMNRSAANSLLKTLEEPPATSILILISQQPSLLPVTIRSRCQRLNFTTGVDAMTTDWLVDRLTIDPAEARNLLLMAQGQPLEAVALAEENILEKQQTLIRDMESLCRTPADPIALAKQWLDYGLVDVLTWLLTLVQAMVTLKLGHSTDSEMDDDLRRIANQLDLRQLVGCYDVVLKNYRAASGPFNLNPQGMLEEIVVYWQSLKPVKMGA